MTYRNRNKRCSVGERPHLSGRGSCRMCGDEGETCACERKAQSFCLQTRRYMNVSACCTPCTLYSFWVRKLSRWSLSRHTTSANRSKLPVQMMRYMTSSKVEIS